MKEIEMEKVYLVKSLPKDLKNHKSITIKICDFFDPNRVNTLKLRQKGDNFELIKKETKNVYERVEHQIDIVKGEFDTLWKAGLQKHEKVRIFYPLGKLTCEIDIYKGKLDGYVRVEVEFKTKEDMNKFIAPNWFDKEITEFNHDIHEDLGLISFNDIKERFAKKHIQLLKISDLTINK